MRTGYPLKLLWIDDEREDEWSGELTDFIRSLSRTRISMRKDAPIGWSTMR
jgi:hypothetical protein